MERCGFFTAMNLVLDKMKVEQEVDVFSAVKRVRMSRQHFITSLVIKWFSRHLHQPLQVSSPSCHRVRQTFRDVSKSVHTIWGGAILVIPVKIPSFSNTRKIPENVNFASMNS